jgi:hypothetical protein
MLNIKVLAVSHVDSYIVFFVTTVWLPLCRAREEHVTDLPEKAPVPGVSVTELESDLAACPAGLTEFRSNVSFVNFKIHDLPLFLGQNDVGDSCLPYGGAWGKRSKKTRVCQSTFMALPESIRCVLYLPGWSPNGISEQAY